jgi:putative aldouronate transport system substrate-binding protein
MKRKFVLQLVSVVLVVVMLAACGSPAAPVTQAPVTTTTTTTAAAGAAETTTAAAADAATTTTAAAAAAATTTAAAPVADGGLRYPLTLEVAWDDVRFTEGHNSQVVIMLEDYIGHNIRHNQAEDTGGNDGFERTMARMAAGDMPMRLQDGFPINVVNNWIRQGLIIPKDPAFIQQRMPLYHDWIHYWMDDPYQFGYRDGQLYWLPVIWTLAYNATTVGIRDDWMNNLGLEEPKTLDEFEAVLHAFANNDPTGTGGTTYGITGMDSLYYVTSMVWGAFDVVPSIFYERNGEVVFGDVQPEAREALAVLNRWYQAGYIDPEYMVNKRENVAEKMVAGRVGMVEEDWYRFIPELAFWNGIFYEALVDSIPDISFTILAPFTGPGGHATMRQQNPNRGGVMFTTRFAGNQELVGAFYDWYQAVSFSEEAMTFCRWGVEGVTYRLNELGGREWIPPYDQVSERDKFGINQQGGGTNFNNYELQAKFMTAPQYMDLRNEVGYKSFGKFDIMEPVERPIYSRVVTDLKTYIESGVIDFITGARSLDDFDAFVQGWYNLGGTNVLAEANEMYNIFFN